MSTKSVIFVLGGPGCGKGTQAISISKEYGIGYAAAGDILRAEAADPNSPHGKEISEIMKAGKLVPPELICETIKKTIEQSPCKYFLMDGFPRSPEQDEAFRKLMPPCTAVALLEAPDDVLLQRCCKRGETSGRADDNAETVRKRIVTYKKDTEEVLSRYQKEGKVFTINADQPIEAVRADFVAKLKQYWEI